MKSAGNHRGAQGEPGSRPTPNLASLHFKLRTTPEPGQALFDMASVFTNRLQRLPDIFSRLN